MIKFLNFLNLVTLIAIGSSTKDNLIQDVNHTTDSFDQNDVYVLYNQASQLDLKGDNIAIIENKKPTEFNEGDLHCTNYKNSTLRSEEYEFLKHNNQSTSLTSFGNNNSLNEIDQVLNTNFSDNINRAENIIIPSAPPEDSSTSCLPFNIRNLPKSKPNFLKERSRTSNEFFKNDKKIAFDVESHQKSSAQTQSSIADTQIGAPVKYLVSVSCQTDDFDKNYFVLDTVDNSLNSPSKDYQEVNNEEAYEFFEKVFIVFLLGCCLFMLCIIYIKYIV